MKHKYLLLIAMFLTISGMGIAQVNVAPSAVPTHSGGGAAGTPNYSATNYNDGVIQTGTFGWVTANNSSGTSAWIQFVWPTKQPIDSITFYPDDATTRTLTGATIQYWDGATWVNHHSYSGVTPSTMYSVAFPIVRTTQLRITNFEITGAYNQNPALNEIKIWLAKNGENNAGVTAILNPAGSCAGEYEATARVQNLGVNAINSVVVEWELNGVAQSPVNVTTPLDIIGGTAPSYTDVALGTVTLSAGITDKITAWTTLPNNQADTVSVDDTTSRTYTDVLSTVASYPHIQDYEGGQADWEIGGTVTTWAFGTPAKPVINGAASGINAFVTGLSTQYVNGENGFVRSPCFDFSSMEGEPWVAMDVWWNSEFSWDGLVLQYSINNGFNWTNVGKMGDPYNWYNDNTIAGNPGGQQEGWSGRNSSSNGSGGWKRVKHPLPMNLVGNRNIIFRLAFGSDGSIVDDGVAFDNFIIADYKRAQLGPDVISLCGDPSLVLDPGVNAPGKIEWSDGDTTSLTLNVNTAGSYWVSFTDSLLDLTSGDTIEIVDTDPPQINFTTAIDTVDVNKSATIDPNLGWYDLTYNWTPGNVNYPFLLVKGSEWGLGAHSFTLHVEDSVFCSDEATAIVVFVDITGVDEINPAQVTFYPNPVKDLMTVQFTNMNADQIVVYNMVGQVIESVQINKLSKVELDVRDYKSGMYILEVRAGNERVVHQFIKK